MPYTYNFTFRALEGRELDYTEIDNNFRAVDERITAVENIGGAWVDLRPYLKPGFFWKTARNGKNAHPRARVLPSGLIEFDGVISFNETSAATFTSAVVLNLPAELRPKYTSGGMVFIDTVSPISFYTGNVIVYGEDEYSPPRVHGDVQVITGRSSVVMDGAISLTGFHAYKE